MNNDRWTLTLLWEVVRLQVLATAAHVLIFAGRFVNAIGFLWVSGWLITAVHGILEAQRSIFGSGASSHLRQESIVILMQSQIERGYTPMSAANALAKTTGTEALAILTAWENHCESNHNGL